MAWNGSGQFLRDYNWQADRDAGIKILAARMDGEFDNYQGGLDNCLTLDGQNSPTANISWNGNKLTNLATPTAAADAVTKAYVDANAVGLVAGTFLPYGSAFTWVSATSFKVNGLDGTPYLTAGRRAKITHNNGATTSYATVVSSSFSTDTTVTVLVDNAVAIVTPVTALAIGLEALLPDALPRRTYVGYNGSANLPTTSGAWNAISGGGKLAYADPFGELVASTGIFTPARSGMYRVSLGFTILRNSATVSAGYTVQIGYGPSNGGSMSITGLGSTSHSVTLSLSTFIGQSGFAQFNVPLTAATAYRWWAGNAGINTYSGGPMTVAADSAAIEALYYN